MTESTTRKAFTLTQLATALNKRIAETFGSQRYWVIAEVARIGEKGGHYYLELADNEGRQTTAKMQGVIWKTTFSNFEERFGPELHQILKVGNRVLLRVQIDFHNLYGLKLYIDDIDPSVTYGDIEKAKQETITRLKKEGLFDLQKQLYLPELAMRLAIVGSLDTSGFRDCVQELTTNQFYQGFQIKMIQASVQGERAVRELVQAISEAETYDVDAILLVRGGGSKMDLDVFNQYELCRAICQCSKPVITGIGHETDDVVAGMVSCENAITPTAAAKGVATRIGVFRGKLRESEDALVINIQQELAAYKQEFAHIQKYFGHYGIDVIRDAREVLRSHSHSTHFHGMGAVQQGRNALENALQRCRDYALSKADFEGIAVVPALSDHIEQLVFNQMDQSKVALDHLHEKFYLVNPERLLESGYTLSTVDGTDLNQAEGDLVGKKLLTLTAKCLIRSRIEQTEVFNDEGR